MLGFALDALARELRHFVAGVDDLAFLVPLVERQTELLTKHQQVQYGHATEAYDLASLSIQTALWIAHCQTLQAVVVASWLVSFLSVGSL